MTHPLFRALLLGTFMIALTPSVMAEDQAVTASPAPATAPADEMPNKSKSMRPMKADTNNDGFITREEMLEQHKKRIDTIFEKTDTNKDGKLSVDEFKAGREAMRAKREERKEKMKEKMMSKGPKMNQEEPKE